MYAGLAGTDPEMLRTARWFNLVPPDLDAEDAVGVGEPVDLSQSQEMYWRLTPSTDWLVLLAMRILRDISSVYNDKRKVDYLS